jgi:hypothetical protein
MRGIRPFLGVMAALVLLPCVPGSAQAQYFGQNKVQYQTFHFDVIKTDHFDIYYYPEEKPAVEYLVLMAERWYARLSRLLNHDLSSRQPLIMPAPHSSARPTPCRGTSGNRRGA